MGICSKIRLTGVILTSSVLGLVTLPATAARVTVPSIGIRFQCENPDVVARFVAANFPRDVAVFEQALRTGACKYSGTPIRVSPLRFVSTIAAGQAATESIAYIWEVRYSDGNVGYTYFWSTQHHMALNKLRPFSSSLGLSQCASARLDADGGQENRSEEPRRPTSYADAMCSINIDRPPSP